MDIFAVFEHFKTLANITDKEAAQYLSLCAVALASLTAKVKPDVDESSYSVLFTAAAAAEAYYNYVLVFSTQDNEISFSAGDIKVNKDYSASLSSAKALRDSRMSAIAHLLIDEDFDFRAVDGI